MENFQNFNGKPGNCVADNNSANLAFMANNIHQAFQKKTIPPTISRATHSDLALNKTTGN